MCRLIRNRSAHAACMRLPPAQFQMSIFESLKTAQSERWTVLRDLTASDEWWQSVFSASGFVAGGAAAFVGDGAHCVDLLSDVDIWAPVGLDTMRRWIDSLVQLLQFRGVECRVARSSESSVTVSTPYIDFQFIRLPTTEKPDAVIKQFDFTYTQAALGCFVPRGQAQPKLMATRDAKLAWNDHTLTPSANGRRFWCKNIEDHLDRLLVRTEKAFRKGYTVKGAAIEAHECSCAHRRMRPHTQEHDEEYAAKIEALEVFAETTYASATWTAPKKRK
jgi:hypothetical protein